VDGVVKLTEMIDSNDLRGNTEINFCMGKSFSLEEIIDTAEKTTGKILRLTITDSKAFRGRDLSVRSTTIERIIRKKPKTLEQSIGIIVSDS